jgi:hypothetical protein
MPKVSVNEFKAVIHDELDQTAAEFSLGANYDQTTAFRYWIAGLILNAEQIYEGDVADVVIPSKDVGIDLVLEDEANRTLLLCECRYRTPLKAIEEEDVRAFCERHQDFMAPGWIEEYGAPEAVAVLADYPERVQDGWNIEYRFVTTGQANQESKELVRQTAENFEKAGERVHYELHDFSVLKDYYVRSLSLDASIPDEVSIDLPQGQFFVKNDPLPTVIAVIKGNSLKDLYRQHKQSLYAWNIRGYLGNRGINQDIADTAKKEAQHFFYSTMEYLLYALVSKSKARTTWSLQAYKSSMEPRLSPRWPIKIQSLTLKCCFVSQERSQLRPIRALTRALLSTTTAKTSSSCQTSDRTIRFTYG